MSARSGRHRSRGGAGSVAECIAALDRYVASYPKAMTNEEVGMTLGVIPQHEERYGVAAE